MIHVVKRKMFQVERFVQAVILFVLLVGVKVEVFGDKVIPAHYAIRL